MCPRSFRAQRGWYNPASQTRRFVLDETGSLHYCNSADGSPPIRSIKAPPARGVPSSAVFSVDNASGESRTAAPVIA